YLGLPEAQRQPAVGSEIDLVPQEFVCLVQPGARGAAELLLPSLEVEGRHHRVAGGLPVELAVVAREQRLVLGLEVVDAADVLLAVAAVEPQLVLDDRAAKVEA